MMKVAIVLLVYWTTTKALNVREFCAIRRSGVYIQPDDCSSYVTCTHPGGYFVQSCPNGMNYNIITKICDFSYNVDCYQRGKVPEYYNKVSYKNLDPSFRHGLKLDTFKPESSSLNARYAQRLNKAFVPQAYNAKVSTQLFFDHPRRQHQHCGKYATDTDCKRKPSRQRPKTRDLFRPTPDNSQNLRSPYRKKADSGKPMVHFVHEEVIDRDVFKRIRQPGVSLERFLSHTDGIGKTAKEEVTTHHKRERPDGGRTNSRKNSPNRSVVPVSRRQDITDCRNREDGLYSHPASCTTYIQCNRGKVYRNLCPLGTFFNSVTRTCGYSNDDCTTEAHHDLKQIHSSVRKREKTQDGDTMLSTIMDSMNDIKQRARRTTREVFRREARMASDMGYRKGGFSGVSGFLGSTEYAKQLGILTFEQLEVLRLVKDRFKLDPKRFQPIMNQLPPVLYENNMKVSPDMDSPRPQMGQCPYPLNTKDNRCDQFSKYRTFDGSCNNLNRPLWGKSFMPLRRYLPPDYADGIQLPRTGSYGRSLPSARTVSLKLFEDKDAPSHVHTLMHMTFGQFLDHDMARTAVTKLTKNQSGRGEMVDVMCGDSECETEGVENRACLPIQFPADDVVFSTTNKTCLMFVRTQEVMPEGCVMGPREQLNQLTAHLDASMIYGSNKTQAGALRELTNSGRGRLVLREHPYARGRFKGLMPAKFVKDCRDVNSTIECFSAGDGRINEHIGLAAVHHIFHRGHNTIENELNHINPQWDGERLYQEARRIVGAAWQKIIYDEYLPLVLGPQEMRRFGLNLLRTGFFDGYDDSVSTANTNAFTTAAFRFGHSQIQELIRFSAQSFSPSRDKEIELSTVLRRPFHVYNTELPGGSGIDSITLGHCSQPAQTTDRFFTKEVTANLFSENPPKEPGTDLPAINTQRGRDHGLPGYNQWRKWCGLKPAKSFQDLEDHDRETKLKLRSLYQHVDDIDLFPAGVAERHVPGGMVGPTFACIIGRQFRDLRVGDRFWHERRDPRVGFTSAQLREIRKFTFAKFICDNLDHVDKIQRYPMLQPLSEAFRSLGQENYQEIYNLASLYQGENNERRPCSRLPQPNLSHWRERSSGRYSRHI